MPRWYLKAVTQGVISAMPWSHTLNSLAQQHITHSVRLTPVFFGRRLSRVKQHVQAYRQFSTNPRSSFTALELGTGWYPVVPVGLYLCGAAEVVTVDVRSLLTADRVKEVMAGLVRSYDAGELQERLPDVDATRVDVLRQTLDAPGDDPSGLLARIMVRSLVADARALPLPATSLDLIMSNNTLEHIPEPVVEDMFIEFHRAITSSGVMSHAIDLSDHYSQFDRSLSPYNFLRYSDSAWRWFNNELLYQNRLRMSDYGALARRTGWTVAAKTGSAGRPERLQEIQVSERFRGYTQEDLAVTIGWMALRPSANGAISK